MKVDGQSYEHQSDAEQPILESRVESLTKKRHTQATSRKDKNMEKLRDINPA